MLGSIKIDPVDSHPCTLQGNGQYCRVGSAVILFAYMNFALDISKNQRAKMIAHCTRLVMWMGFVVVGDGNFINHR